MLASGLETAGGKAWRTALSRPTASARMRKSPLAGEETVPERLSRILDTAGEFARGVEGRGSSPPGGPILPSLRLIGGLREFASRIESAGEPRIVHARR